LAIGALSKRTHVTPRRGRDRPHFDSAPHCHLGQAQAFCANLAENLRTRRIDAAPDYSPTLAAAFFLDSDLSGAATRHRQRRRRNQASAAFPEALALGSEVEHGLAALAAAAEGDLAL
jgi:hypothetical protein